MNAMNKEQQERFIQWMTERLRAIAEASGRVFDELWADDRVVVPLLVEYRGLMGRQEWIDGKIAELALATGRSREALWADGETVARLAAEYESLRAQGPGADPASCGEDHAGHEDHEDHEDHAPRADGAGRARPSERTDPSEPTERAERAVPSEASEPQEPSEPSIRAMRSEHSASAKTREPENGGRRQIPARRRLSFAEVDDAPAIDVEASLRAAEMSFCDASRSEESGELEDPGFFEDQSFVVNLKERSGMPTGSGRNTDLFERNDGLFNEVNLFLAHIRDERMLSSESVYTYKMVLYRCICIIEKVLPHIDAASDETEQLRAVRRARAESVRSGGRSASGEDAPGRMSRSGSALRIGKDDELHYSSWSQLSRTTVRSLVRELNFRLDGTPHRPAAVAHSIAALGSFYAFLTARGHISVSPVEDVEKPTVRRDLPYVVTEDDARRLIDGHDSSPKGLRDRAIVALCYASGLRVSEAVSLNLGDIDFDLREVRVMGKGSKERIVPVSREAVEHVLAYLSVRYAFKPKDNAMFVNRSGNRLNVRSVQSMVKATAAAQGISSRVTPHKLRHGFATHLMNHGADLRMIQEMLGHSNLSTTEIYTHLNVTDLRRAYNKAHPLASKKDRSKE